MSRLSRWIVVIGCLLVSVACAPKCQRLLVGGLVHRQGRVEPLAVAISEGRVVALLPDADSAAWRRAADEVVELRGGHVYPGFTEAHGHLVGYGAALEQVDLVGTTSFQEVVERVRRAAVGRPPGEWILGRGWDQNDWPEMEFPSHDALSRAVPDHPVALRRIDGHALLANAVALASAGISRSTPDPPGGRILRDEDGEPSGVLVDAAEELVAVVIPAPDAGAVERRAVLACNRLAALGFTEMHDAGTSSQTLAVLRRLQADGRLPIRIYAMLEGSDDDLLDVELAVGPRVTADGMLAVRAVKLYVDGALGSRGAWLSEPYADEPTSRGLQVMPRERLAAVISRAARAGFQPCLHAIGDAAVHRALDLFQRELGADGKGLRPRIEHSQIVREEDVARYGPLGAIASVQPTHCTSDMPWAPARLGEERIAWAYRWRSFLDAGVAICLGSDVPVENPDPRLGIWAAVMRRTPEGTPAEGWNPAESLTVAEAVAGYTAGAAHAAFEDDWRGIIAPAFAADLTVVDRDLEGGSPREILEARILRTVVAGQDAFVAGGGT